MTHIVELKSSLLLYEAVLEDTKVALSVLNRSAIVKSPHDPFILDSEISESGMPQPTLGRTSRYRCAA